MASHCFSISYDQNFPKATSITVAMFNINHRIIVTNFYNACACLVHQQQVCFFLQYKRLLLRKNAPLNNYIHLVINNTLSSERYI